MDYSYYFLEDNYIIIDEEYYNTLIKNIAINHLLILFSLTCSLTILCCSKKERKQLQVAEIYSKV